MKKLLVVGVIVLFLGLAIAPSISADVKQMITTTASGNTLHVGGSGPNNYTKIQDAIDDSSDEDTIFVYNGTYYENIIIYKSINIIGENRNTTIIDGSGNWNVVSIFADWANISGFTIQNSSNLYYNYSGIFIMSQYNIITGNTISHNVDGIFFKYSSGNTITGNIIMNNSDGIELRDSCLNTITDNNIISNNDYSIYILESSNYNNIFHNYFMNNAQNAYDECNNNWDDSYPSGGNYWSDYNGIDEDSDGIGDTPYPIPGSFNEDNYPLMYPWYPTHPNIVYVDDDNSTKGWGYDRFSRVQYGINVVPEGGTVFVFNGTYSENVVVDKSIDLVGENRNKTVIDGNFEGSVITINSDNVVVRGFTLKNIKDYYLHEGKYGCIKIKESKNNLITDNIITPGELKNDDYGDGVYLDGSGAINNLIENNIIFYDNPIGTARGVSIACGAHNNTVYNNEIYGCHNGVRIAPYGSESYNNTIVSNYFHNLNVGVSVHEPAQKTRIINNKITYCAMWGVFVFFADDHLIEGNIIEHCKTGIDLSGYNCYYNSVVNNTLSDNNLGIEVNGNYNTIYHNNFINNIKNARAEDYIYNNWDNGKSGNYWDDYNGSDNDGDGIGDTPQIICENNIDNYPLMEPYNGFDPNAPNAPDINGSTRGKPGIVYNYTFVATDPNGDEVYYYITWGDGTFEEWIGPYASGELVNLSHIWYERKSYPIIARAKDINGLIGPWGSLEVAIPKKYKATQNTIFLTLPTIRLASCITSK